MSYPNDESVGDLLMTGLALVACLGIGVLTVAFLFGA